MSVHLTPMDKLYTLSGIQPYKFGCKSDTDVQNLLYVRGCSFHFLMVWRWAI